MTERESLLCELARVDRDLGRLRFVVPVSGAARCRREEHRVRLLESKVELLRRLVRS